MMNLILRSSGGCEEEHKGLHSTDAAERDRGSLFESFDSSDRVDAFLALGLI